LKEQTTLERCKEIIQRRMEVGETPEVILSNLLEETDYYLQTYRVRLQQTLGEDNFNNPGYLRRLAYYEEMRRAILHLKYNDREPPQ